MGLETLKNAERAAGFAMAPEEDIAGACGDEAVERLAGPLPGSVAGLGWQPADTAVAATAPSRRITPASPSVADWLKGLLGYTSGRAAA